MAGKVRGSALSENDALGRLTVSFEVANYGDIMEHRRGKLAPEKVRRLTMQGVVDSGATMMVLPEQVTKQLGLNVIGKVRVSYADKRSGLRDEVDGLQVVIQGRSGEFRAIVEKKRDTALIGAVVLESLDLLVDCQRQQLVPRDPNYVLTEIE